MVPMKGISRKGIGEGKVSLDHDGLEKERYLHKTDGVLGKERFLHKQMGLGEQKVFPIDC